MGGRTTRSRRFVSILAIAVMLIISACSTPSQTPDTTPTPAPTPAPAPAGPVTLVWGRGGDSVGLDPINVTDGESFKVAHQIYESLLEYKPGGTEVIPALALDWTTSADGKEYTLNLRQGVKFHDGTDFNAEAVKVNFDRWRQTSNPYHKGGEFAYYRYMFGGYDADSVIQEVQATGTHTVKFSLKQVQASFLQDLAMPMFAIASPKAIMADAAGLMTKPVGTGAFKFVSWTKEDRVVLEANADYWDGKPQIERLIYRSVPDNNARLIALQAGELDVMDGMEPAFVPVVQKAGKFDIGERPAMNVGYLAFNMDKAPFDNVLVRQAINFAINRDELNKAFYASMGTPAVSPLPPAVWGHNPDVPKYAYDPDKAKALLAEAGYTADKPLVTELWAMPVPRPYMPQPQNIAVALQTYMRAVGIDAKIVTYDWGTYLQKTGDGEHTMALLGWTGDNGDPDNFLYVLLDKDNAKAPDAGNIAFYRSDPVHDLLIQARQIADQGQRSALYKQAQVKIMEDAPWAPLMHARVPISIRKGVNNLVLSPMGSESLAKVTVTAQQ